VSPEETASPTYLTGAPPEGVATLAPPAASLPLPTVWIVVIVIMVGAAVAVLYLAIRQKI
ncbi:MAG: hypothetical protein LUQ01_05160, partial [Methanolinea sp.]|nr:hypothetical protein [Methanolinea sp.]